MKNSQIIRPECVQVHGTYIHDNIRWKYIQEISKEEVINLLSIPIELRHCEYMWVNKGYIVIGKPYKILNRQIGEGIIPDMFLTREWLKTGDRAIYLQDGTYLLCEYE